MYAIVEIAGKHYKVEKGSEIDVDLLNEEKGKKLNFESVIVYRPDKDVKIGSPYVGGVSVEAEVVDPLWRDDKVTVFKFRHKTNYRRKTGHRQNYTTIKIKAINEKAKAEKPAAEQPAEQPAQA
jgi:large subunit ribosomal protein L21